MSDSENSSEFEELGNAIDGLGSDSDDDNSEDEIDEKPAKNKKNFNPENSELLDKVLFGDKSTFVDKIDKIQGEKSFYEDLGENEKISEPATSVWHDSDDENVEKSVKLKSKRKFERITGVNPSWASLDKKKRQKTDDSDDEDEISRSVGHLSSERGEDIAIPKGSILFKRLANMNKTTNREGRICAVDFHPRSTVGIVAGYHGMVSLFAIDGEENKKVFNYTSSEIFTKSSRILDSQRKI